MQKKSKFSHKSDSNGKRQYDEVHFLKIPKRNTRICAVSFPLAIGLREITPVEKCLDCYRKIMNM